ncbi:MAG: helix-turn-helix transcriptional regulator, partial [Bacteroidales bacterium]|nr:helix-turn-helix transcriptional regulator [Bacteroidales bacterium]
FEYDNPEPTGLARVFLMHPELNAAAVGRRLGISQSLMAQYINGIMKPSPERERLILDEIAKLAAVRIDICK